MFDLTSIYILRCFLKIFWILKSIKLIFFLVFLLFLYVDIKNIKN